MTEQMDDGDTVAAPPPLASRAFVSEIVVATLLILFSSALLVQVVTTDVSIWQEGRGPAGGFLATIFASGLLVLGFINLVAAARSRAPASPDDSERSDRPAARASRTRLWVLVAIIVLAPVLMTTVGAVPTIVAVVFAMQLLIERMKWWTSLLIAVTTAGLGYLLFEVALGLRLPSGMF